MVVVPVVVVRHHAEVKLGRVAERGRKRKFVLVEVRGRYIRLADRVTD